MALLHSLRRGALQQQALVHELLSEHRLLGVRFLRGRKKKEDAEDSSKPADGAIDPASGAKEGSWDSAFSKVVKLVDEKLDYFRAAHEQAKSRIGGKGVGSEKGVSGSKQGPDALREKADDLGGNKRGSNEGGRARFPWEEAREGSMPFEEVVAYGRRTVVSVKGRGEKHEWIKPSGPEPPESGPSPEEVVRAYDMIFGNDHGSATRSGGFSFANPGNGSRSGEGASGKRLSKGAKRVLEDASKELEAAAKKKGAKNTKVKGQKDQPLLSTEAKRELEAAGNRRAKRELEAAAKRRAEKPGKGKKAASKKGAKKGKAEPETASVTRPTRNRVIRMAREDLEGIVPEIVGMGPSLDWNEEYRISSAGKEPSDVTRRGGPFRRELPALKPKLTTRKGREAVSTEGPEEGDPPEGGGVQPVTRRGRNTKVTDGTVARKVTKKAEERETAKKTKKRTPKSSALPALSEASDSADDLSENGEVGGSPEASSSGGAVSEDGLVRILPRGLKELTPARSRKSAPVGAGESAVSPLPEARQLYTEMKEREREGKLGPLAKEDSSGHRKALAVLTRFTERGWASDQALALYVNHELYPVVAARFKDLVLRGCTDELAEWIRTTEPSDAAEEALFPLFAELCLQEFRAELRQFRKLVESANLTEPQKWYPYARAMKRKIIYHCGPTNSGKTYEALQRLKKAENGLYCGPLRLLAMEIFDTLNADGVYCNLTTGQERRTMPFANHTSCTVEMAHLGNEYEVAVIDEIQMMADDHRGWAWTRALLGLQAKEIHVCGDSSVLKMLQDVAETCGDEFVVRNYERWKPLSVESQALGGTWRNVTEGDCVVAFSRKEIFRIKEEIEAHGKHNCCVIYGALPPETRRQQAKLFNDPDSDYKVLVASDAIGMGLNLNIRRMVFSTMEKFAGGTGKETIPTPMVKQIAGRAGRRNSSHPEGLASAYHSADLTKLREAMAAPMQTAKKAGLFPIFEQMELFAGQLPDVRFPALLDKFAETSLLDSSYFLCKHDQIRTIALLLEAIPTLTLRDRFSLCQAPINTRSPEAMGFLLTFAKAYAEGKEVPLKITFGATPDIQELEWKHQVVSAYLWLSYQLQTTQFPHRGKAEQLLTSMVEELDRRLADRVNKHSKRSAFFRPKDFSFMPALGKQKREAKEEPEGLAIAAAV